MEKTPHGTAIGIKMAFAVANIFMATIETNITAKVQPYKPLVWRRYIDNVLSF